MTEVIELHCTTTAAGIPIGLMADLGEAMAKIDSDATFDACQEHPSCWRFRAERGAR